MYKKRQAIYKSSNYRTVNPVVDVTWAISGSNFTDSKYTWNVEELGDLTETNSNPSGVFVGSGVHRNSARAEWEKLQKLIFLIQLRKKKNCLFFIFIFFCSFFSLNHIHLFFILQLRFCICSCTTNRRLQGCIYKISWL